MLNEVGDFCFIIYIMPIDSKPEGPFSQEWENIGKKLKEIQRRREVEDALGKPVVIRRTSKGNFHLVCGKASQVRQTVNGEPVLEPGEVIIKAKKPST